MMIDRGKKLLYVRVLKAIHSMIESALRWYELYTTTLKHMVLKFVPYKKFVAIR